MLWEGGWPIALLFLLGMAVILWLVSRRWQQRTGLPSGHVIYSDSGAWHANDDTLTSAALRLAGKPDYLVEQADGSIVPVELKSGDAPDAPWDSHLMQLAAYCLLVEENFSVRPAYGILQYRDRAFAVDYSQELEGELLDLLDEIRVSTDYGELERDHDEWQRCAACSLRHHCDQRLD